VNPRHLEELFASQEYHHRVVVNESGEFVAYCETSFYGAEWQHSGQRLGWIDYIGTRPEDQRRGLGRALLLDSLRHLQVQGAETAILVTVSSNAAAIGLYQNTGFEVLQVREPARYQIMI
jgi:mycothiol synthase